MTDTTTTTTTDTAPDPAPPTQDTTTAPDPTAELVALKAQVAELLEAKTKAEQAAAEAERAKMSDAEKLAADRAALDAQRKALKDRARSEALAKMGVIAKAHQWAPDVDPIDPAGAKALEEWAKANPELVKKPDPTGPAWDVPAKSPLAAILTGEKKNPLLSAAHAAKLIAGIK